jgi:hypothetical protein
LPDDLPHACLDHLPDLVTGGFLTHLDGDRYRLDSSLRHLAGRLPHRADPDDSSARSPAASMNTAHAPPPASPQSSTATCSPMTYSTWPSTTGPRPTATSDTARTLAADTSRSSTPGGRLAPAARRGLAQAARLAGDFPTTYAAAQTLGEGRHQRVLDDVWWVQGEPARAAAAYQAGRLEAEQHAKAGEAAHNQALRALAIAFYDPHQADNEIDLAEQLLAHLDLRATRINAAIAALIRDAGHPTLDGRVQALRTELDVAGLTSMAPTLELAAAFHQAVLEDHDGLSATIS